MVTTVPGSEIITSGLNMISQSLQIPVIIFLVVFAVFAVLAIGGLISEYTSRKKITPDLIEELIYSISNASSLEEIKNVISNAKIYESQKVVLIKILRSSSLTQDSRHALAKKLIEFEENKFTKSIERTDVENMQDLIQAAMTRYRELYPDWRILFLSAKADATDERSQAILNLIREAYELLGYTL